MGGEDRRRREDGTTREKKMEREEDSWLEREFEGLPRRRGFHLSGFPRTRASPYPISFPRQFPSVNSIIYRYTPHPNGSTSVALPRRGRHPSLRPSLAFSSSSSSFHIYSQMQSKQDPGPICFSGFLSHVGPIVAITNNRKRERQRKRRG